MFPRLKSALKGRGFCNVNEIKNAAEELKRLSQNDFQECFQHLYCCWQKCNVAKRDRFEGNIAYVLLPFCMSQK